MIRLYPRRSYGYPAHGIAFTLIELLVVMAIISLLIAILLPSIERARMAAKESGCLSNVKNIGTAGRIYAIEDPQEWGIPAHPLLYSQGDRRNPIYIGAYEWGGKSGIGWSHYLGAPDPVNSRYGTKAGFGPATRPLNQMLYKAGFADHATPTFNRVGALQDTTLDLALLRCPGDDGPPRGAHCPDWVLHTERTSYDQFGTSYAANLFMIGGPVGDTPMWSNSPYLRPLSRVPNPTRTLLYEENIGRWAWATRREACPTDSIFPGVDPGPTKTVRGWHGRDWTYNRCFVDSHAERQKVYIEGTEDEDGYAAHYRMEDLVKYPVTRPSPQSNSSWCSFG